MGEGSRDEQASEIRDAAEASQELVAFMTAQRELATLQTDLIAVVTALDVAVDRQALPLHIRIEQTGSRLERWALRQQPNRDGCILLTTGRLGWQQVPATVEIADEGMLIRWLQERRMTAFLAAVIDREAILQNAAAAAEMPGVRIRPGRLAFVVTPAAVPPAPGHARRLQP